MYNLLFLAEGKLPWTADRGQHKFSVDDVIQMKQSFKSEDLFENLPSKLLYLPSVYK
jgi:hypothetical protein